MHTLHFRQRGEQHISDIPSFEYRSLLICALFTALFLFHTLPAYADEKDPNEYTLIWYEEVEAYDENFDEYYMADVPIIEIQHNGTYTVPFDEEHDFTMDFDVPLHGVYADLYFVHEDGERELVHTVSMYTKDLFGWEREGVYELDIFDTGPPILSKSSSWLSRLLSLFVPETYAAYGDYLATMHFTIFAEGGIPLPDPACELQITPDTIERGQTAELAWTSEYAEIATLNHGVGAVETTGSLSVQPQATTSYELVVTNASGQTSCEATVQVLEPAIFPLHKKAAELAKQLVNQPKGYLLGGKGWDYTLAEFTTSDRILSGYTTHHAASGGSATTSVGVDCSGLVTWAFNRANDPKKGFGENIVQYPTADGIYRDPQSDEVSESELAPGDVLHYDWEEDGKIDHVAMYVGESGGYDIVNAGSEDLGIFDGQVSIFKNLDGFKAFRRIHQADVELKIQTGSPVDLVVTDPDGYTLAFDDVEITKEEYLREISGELYYIEQERGHDGNPIDTIYAPRLKEGEYKIVVVPNADAQPDDTYSLTFTAGTQEYIIVDNERIDTIPEEFLVTVDAGDVEIEVVAEKTVGSLVEELSMLLDRAIISPRFLKKRLQANVVILKQFLLHDREWLARITLYNTRALIERRSGSGIEEAVAQKLVGIINELLVLLNT